MVVERPPQRVDDSRRLEAEQENARRIGALVPGSAALRLLYGGSVKPDNAARIMAVANVDGVLVGGASLDADQFDAIYSAGQNART